MKTLEEIKRELKKLKPILKKKYKVREIGIFGSYIKGEQRKRSDLDILIEFEDSPDLYTYIEIKNFSSLSSASSSSVIVFFVINLSNSS